MLAWLDATYGTDVTGPVLLAYANALVSQGRTLVDQGVFTAEQMVELVRT